MTDRIELKGIELFAYGGVTEAERQIGQRYRVDVTLELDLEPASRSDDLGDTGSYAEVYEIVAKTFRERPFNLLESVAGRILNRLLTGLPVDAATVRVTKLLPPIDGIVAEASVEMRRSRHGDQA